MFTAEVNSRLYTVHIIHKVTRLSPIVLYYIHTSVHCISQKISTKNSLSLSNMLEHF